jgi:hypothetical protein
MQNYNFLRPKYCDDVDDDNNAKFCRYQLTLK